MLRSVRALVATAALALGLLWPAAAIAVEPAPTPTTAATPSPSTATPDSTPTTATPSPGSDPPGAQFRPDEGNNWSGTLTILGFFAVAAAGLVLIVRKGLGSSDSED